jgi:hypothetical protein
MALRDVPREQWVSLLEEFSRRHRTWLATVTQRGDAIGRSDATQAPLGAVTTTVEGRNVSAIEIAFAGDGHIPLRVEHPRIVRVQTDEGAESRLEIVDDEGVATRVRFSQTRQG